ncbi:MAG: thioredoxin family protein [Verrucomicrobia bacterium]|nr:thioredoxin family protein [Verrucomicrobiota bacterium]MDA1204153.1 thioredoxin family protein [Verrucomicrobiota bacterium]
MHIVRKATLALVLAASPALAVAEVGQPAPGFTLTDSNGQSHNLSDFKGKFVVLEWLNHGCPFVIKHYDSGSMQKLQKEYTGQDVIWLSVVSSAPGKQGHLSPAETNQAKEEKGSAATAILIDGGGTVGQLYGAKVTPELYVINPAGDLIYAGAIDDKKSVDPADVAGATNHVKQALDEALAGQPVSTPRTEPYGCSIKYN